MIWAEKKYIWIECLVVILVAIVLASCTDSRPLKEEVVVPPTVPTTATLPPEPTANVEFVADVQFDGAPTQVFAMKMVNNRLYATGRPFALFYANVGANPQNPQMTAAAINNLKEFSNNDLFGPWVLDWLGTLSVESKGSKIFTSGPAGLSVISQAELNHPVEVERHPSHAGGNRGTDEAYVYHAMVAHPTLDLLYGFREQDFLYTLDISGTGARVIRRDSYLGSNTCCVRGATFFNDKIYVATLGSLWIVSLNADGTVQGTSHFDALNAIQVAKSQGHLWVMHEQTAERTAKSGLYVFDSQNRPVEYFPVFSPVFAVNHAGTHVYAATADRIEIYRTTWR